LKLLFQRFAQTYGLFSSNTECLLDLLSREHSWSKIQCSVFKVPLRSPPFGVLFNHSTIRNSLSTLFLALSCLPVYTKRAKVLGSSIPSEDCMIGHPRPSTILTTSYFFEVVSGDKLYLITGPYLCQQGKDILLFSSRGSLANVE